MAGRHLIIIMQLQIRRKSLVKSLDNLSQSLESLLRGSFASLPALTELELSDRRRAQAFRITEANVTIQLQKRVEILRQVYPTFCQECDRALGNPDHYLPTLWQLWLPLAQQLATHRQHCDRPIVQGILGGQGTGKTTLGRMLTLILATMGYRTLNWSLDDLYKTYSDRLQLQHHMPELIWRGPPGTHDVELGIQVLDQLRHPTAGQKIAIPRFDKSLHSGMGDRTTPELVQNIDIVLFEGWFVGVRPVETTAFTNPPSPIVTEGDRAFAQACNQRLHNYLPLWQRLDHLWVLYPTDYRLSKQWRKQAEAQMKASGKPGMTDAEIDTFVEYFWKALHPDLFIRPALAWAELAIEINADHSTNAVKRGVCGEER